MHGDKVNAVLEGCVPDLPSDSGDHDRPPAHVIHVGLGRVVVSLDQDHLVPHHRS